MADDGIEPPISHVRSVTRRIRSLLCNNEWSKS
jgi:hypothetical protein